MNESVMHTPSAVTNRKHSFIEPLVIASSCALLLAAIAFWAGQREDISPLLGGLILALGILPLLIQAGGNSLPIYPLFAMHGIFVGITYGLAPTLLNWSPIPADPDKVVFAQYVVVISFAACCFAYVLTTRLVGNVNAGYSRISKYSLSQLQFPAWFFLVATELVKSVEIEGATLVIRVVGEFSRVILYLLAFRPGAVNPTKAIVVACLIPYDLIKGLTSGFTAPVLIVILYTFAGYYYWRRKLPWMLTAIAMAAYFAFSPIKQVYREMTWHSPEIKAASPWEKIGILIDSGRHMSGKFAEEEVLQAAISRLDHLDTLARIISDTPDSFPYLYGESLTPILYKPIPRFFWPEKPEERLANVWAYRYGLLDPSDTETSFNLPWFSELYMNFSTIGCVMGMFLFGIFFRLLEVHYFSANSAPIPFAIGVTVCVMLWYAESNISLVWGGVPVAMVFLYLFTRMLLAYQHPVGVQKALPP